MRPDMDLNLAMPAMAVRRAVTVDHGSVFSIARHELRNVMRSRWLLAYGLFFLVLTDALLRFNGDGGRALLSIGSVLLFVVPLVGLVFGTTYLYDAREFTELLLAQPVSRTRLYLGLLGGLLLPLAAALVVGVTLPFVWHRVQDVSQLVTLAILTTAGVALTATFVGLAFLIAMRSTDKVRGLGLAVGIWLVLSLLYDGIVLVLVALFSDYPIDRALLGLMLANPVDLARVLMLLRFDAGALQGYTGAVFAQFFGGATGMIVSGAALAAWAILPAYLGLRAFRRRDF